MPPTRRDMLTLLAAGLCGAAAPRAWAQPGFGVRGFGAAGDGRSLDTGAFNRAIAAAAAAGGGTVHVPAGTYACHSIRLRSNVALYLEPGATILAADAPPPGSTGPGYDAPEPNAPWDEYQDFGHSHWHNSLIWGEGLHDVAILGEGRIWGRGLVRERDEPGWPDSTRAGVGNKAIALKRCHNVTLRDFAIQQGGHFGILATGVDNLTIDNLTIDTNRDGMNVDCCRNVRITGCTVNSPWDDGIALKSSLALGERRATENVTISGCTVYGDYRLGTLLDGSLVPIGQEATALPGRRNGRIKLGTESDGGFSNIAITNCTFQSCRGIALETVDGGALEDVTISNIAMRDLRNAPLFLRLGARLRCPSGTGPGRLRRIAVSNVVCEAPRSAEPCIITGVPGHCVEDIQVSDFSMVQRGGGAAGMLGLLPPEEIAAYPDPGRFGPLPAQGFFIRHARDLSFSHIDIDCATPDARPAFWTEDVEGLETDHIQSARSPTGPMVMARSAAAPIDVALRK